MQLLVRVIDNDVSVEPTRQAKTTQRGDVIAVQDDSHVWGRLELTSPDWIILKAPITKAAAEAMTSAEPGGGPLARIRAFHLNLDALRLLGYTAIPTLASAVATRTAYSAEPGSLSAAKHSPVYARSTPSITITEADFIAAKVRKPILSGVAVIG